MNKKKDKIKEVSSFYSYWSNYPIYYRFLSSFFGYHTYLKNKAIGFLSLKKRDIVLDIGCGPGNAFRKLENSIRGKGKIIAIDCSDGMIEKCRKKIITSKWKNITLIHGDISNCNIKKIDKAISLNSLSAIPEHEKAIDNVHDSLKKGGIFVVFDMIPERFMDILRYQKSYQKKDVIESIKKRFKNVRIIRYPLSVFIAIAKK